MVYADPLPHESSDASYDQLGRPYYLSRDKLAGDFAPARFVRELALLRRFCPRGEVLDVGCSTGAFLHALERRFPGEYRTFGIDVSRPAVGYARERGLDVAEGSLLTHDFGARRFDAVVFWAVLEHLPDPTAFLRRAAKLLLPGGLCFTLVPNFRSLASRLLGARYRYVLPQHVNYFTLETLQRLLSDTGLSVAATGTCHFNPAVLYQDWRRGEANLVPDAERAALLSRTTRWKQSPWLAPARWIWRATEFLLATGRLADNAWVVGAKPR